MSATQEMINEIELRSSLHPEQTRRVGNFGFIELEDHWGDEATIINTARISTTHQRVQPGAAFTDKDYRLLCELLRNQHGTPFETVYFRFRFVAPIFVLRQWVKHRISSWNEFSLRYRKPIDAFYVPENTAREADGFEVLDDAALHGYVERLQGLFDWYEEEYARVCARIDAARTAGTLPPKSGGRDPYRGRARELLRNALPLAAYSDVYWTVNFRSLMNFFALRRKAGAQYEIREYADAAFELVQTALPTLARAMEEVSNESE